jgi:2-C-methyl-D-erythritol 4-phosphate cytidylyltransferase
MYKLGAVIILIFAAFFFGRSTGIDKVTVKCQEKEIKQAQEVNNVQHEIIKNRPVNNSELANRLRKTAKAKRENRL